MGPARFVIFDLDGTLVDTAPDIASALTATLRESGIAPPSVAEVIRMIGDGSRTLISRALEHARATRDVDHLLARFLEHYGQHVCVGSAVYPGVEAGMDRLARAGLRAAVVTNKPGALARALLGALGIASRFVSIVGDGDGYPRKPDPGGAADVLRAAGVRPDEAAVVGDGPADIRLGRALGARAIAVGWGYSEPERLAQEGPEIIAKDVGEVVGALLSQHSANGRGRGRS